MENEPLLQLSNVFKRYGAVQALNNVSIELRKGEVTALLGDNGAGKSTLVKVLSGAISPDSGDFRMRGEKVHVSSPAEAQAHGIATVYQDLALCDNLDVVGNLFLGRPRGRFVLDEETMEKESYALLERLAVRLPSARVKVASMSGGQRQSIAITRSLLGDPSVVLLDEPTAALGVSQTKQVLDLILQLKDHGYAVVLITHNMLDAKSVADRAVVLRLGQNNGVFRMSDVTGADLVAAITGASTQDSDTSAKDKHGAERLSK
ncbi:ATP-binding cassette domain-containing protein [Leucobacter sp. UCD-THU]|uniref:ATP-binding cassette domain-containing protein n=1 Tax=Leucobacter sp. UCD-THU TaxID=1292023 RepID=UPI0009DB34F7|nr:ATP-binding cassette domain-containing protein [Leucobacter sp. UCD-THU]